jgi:hypothetical protein
MLYADGVAQDDTDTDSDDGIIREAVERWKACKEWQGVEDERAREDIKFANGDPRNQWQWEKGLYEDRDGQDMPCLTINNTRVHNDLIINQMMKNGYGIKIKPMGGVASYKSAEVYQSIVRRIQNISRFETHRRKVAEQQVDGGIGYIIIETKHVSERSFDQDIYLKAARDPTAVYLDPWITEPDGLDANFGFEFERMSRKQFKRKYPKYADQVGTSPLVNATDMEEWISDKEILLCKYHRKSDRPDTLVAFRQDESGEYIEKLASEIKEESGQELFDALMDDIKNSRIDGKTRKVFNPKVEWFMIAGNKIVERGPWAGKYIPISRCVGRELVIDGTLDRKGHTRPLINAQHLLNYAASSAAEYAGSATKSQWLAPARATEGQEQWKDGNRKNYAVMTYNDVDDEAPSELQRIDPPQKIPPPQPNPVVIQLLESTERQMMMISGQFQAQMGENDTQSAASGKAIGERQQQGDTATYHFPEHQGDMLRNVGTQLIDLIPKIYDTKRALQVMDEDGDKRWISIDPTLETPVEELKQEKDDEEAIRLAFNPSLGEYECVSDPGPDYATQRQEAWGAMSMILQQNMQLAGVIGDLLFKYGDFPGAEKIQERLQKEIKALKPYLFDDAKDPQVMGLQHQLQALQAQAQKLASLNAELVQKLALKEIALKGKDEKRDIEAHRAETDRMKAQIEAIERLTLTPRQKAEMQHELMAESHSVGLQSIVDANRSDIEGQSQSAQQEHEMAMATAQQEHEANMQANAPTPAGSGS